MERAGIEPATSGLQSGAAEWAAPPVSWLYQALSAPPAC
jgi:hypothetical protein